jgi:hypothetical protein
MNERRNTANYAHAILTWGLAWGAAEATFGHLLHWIPVPGLAGVVMAPIGIWAMSRAVREAGRPAAAFAVSALAAAIKMADILLPGRGPVMAWRPALAILAEGLIVSLALAMTGLAVKAASRRVRRRPI